MQARPTKPAADDDEDREDTKIVSARGAAGQPQGTSNMRIEVMAGVEQGKQFVIKPIGEMVIGRSSKADICIKDDHLSRAHAKLVSTGGAGLWLVDLNSLNGTHVNSERIQGRLRLNTGDLIQIGSNVLKVVTE